MMEFNSLLILLEAAEYLERRDRGISCQIDKLKGYLTGCFEIGRTGYTQHSFSSYKVCHSAIVQV